MTEPLPPTTALEAAARIQPRERALRDGHPGLVIWLTGLSGSGKTTISRALEHALFRQGRHVYALDGDELRHGLNADLGFSREGRAENIRRVAEVAALFSRAGLIAITACISPFCEDRDRARRIALQAGCPFVEVYLDTPLAICESRDVKGLYQRARAGQIADFTGIDSPYEAPTHPEVRIETGTVSVSTAVGMILDFLGPFFAQS